MSADGEGTAASGRTGPRAANTSPRAAALSIGLVGLFVIVTLATLAVLVPAMNNGDYIRVTRSLHLFIPIGVQPAMCVPFGGGPVRVPASPLALLGVVQGDLSQMFGFGCFSMRLLFLILSAVYWAGIAAIMRGQADRRRRWPIVGLALVYYMLFSPFFLSFYEEAFFIAFAPFAALLGLRTRRAAALSALILFLLITAKAQAVLLAPVLFLMLPRPRGAAEVRRWVMLCVVLAVSMGLTFYKAKRINHGIPNSYDRIYNGLGWAELGVANWPETTFLARKTHVNAIRATLPASIRQRCSPSGLALMGTSYWPYGKAIVYGVTPASATARLAVTRLGFGDFFTCLREMPSPWLLPVQVGRVTVKSDYATRYIFPTGPGVGAAILSATRAAVLRYGAWLALALGGVVLALKRDPKTRLAIAYLLLLSPALIWLGDGFYEFEKHMVPNIAFLMACTMISFRQGEAARQK